MELQPKGYEKINLDVLLEITRFVSVFRRQEDLPLDGLKKIYPARLRSLCSIWCVE
jgi:hypothetical protein